MTPFLIVGALLVLLALALLTRPLWRRAGIGGPSAEGADASALRQQITQLAALHAAGALAEAQYREARGALEKRLVASVVGAPAVATSIPAQGSPKVLLASLAGFVVVVTVAGYAWVGTPQGLNSAALSAQAQPQEGGAGHTVTREQIDGMAQTLAARLKERPDDADGWAMLGRTYAVLERHADAVPAFKQAVSLRPGDAALIADYADALAAANGRNLEGEPSRLIDQALKLDPNNLKALSLAGTAEFNRQNYAGAIGHWEKLAQLAPAGEMIQQVQGGIDEARRRMGVPSTVAVAPPAAAPVPAATPAPPALPGAGADSVSGTVTLAAALAGKVAPDDTLFVFARAAEGPRMPLAILRKQVKDLPLTFKLDDSMAMSPAARLSSVPRVVVGARISKAGDALPRPGDLQGFSAAVPPGASSLKIEISDVFGR